MSLSLSSLSSGSLELTFTVPGDMRSITEKEGTRWQSGRPR